jgi:phenylpyruvate tautomerase PptA (4-oxalocrotonate tautomerase family)
VRIFLREYPPDNASQDGRLQSEPVRPVFFIEGPPLARIESKRKMVQEVNAAIAEAYQGLTNTREILILVNEYPLHNAGLNGRLQSENPQLLEAVKQAAG